jgi:hypothetical protein
MHGCSDTIGAIASALAKAQGDLGDRENGQTVVLRSPFPDGTDPSHDPASLARRLNLVRKSLSEQEIATIQTTFIDQESGQIRLTTLLAHTSGEWISSIWPVCLVSETAAPHRMEAALACARRCALFTLVGVVGEDDLDAPDILSDPPPADYSRQPEPLKTSAKAATHRPPVLNQAASAELRDEFLSEIAALNDGEDLAPWANRRPPAKNTPTTADGHVESADHGLVVGNRDGNQTSLEPARPAVKATVLLDAQTVTPMTKPVRRRNKTHLAFVAEQPCLICKRSPCDAHHLKFAQPNTLGRKVSDEFTVPLCRHHHHDLHRGGNEMAWWANMNIAPTDVARELWQSSPIHGARAVSP